MTNFMIGAIFAIVALIISGLIMDRSEARRIKKELGEDYIKRLCAKIRN